MTDELSTASTPKAPTIQVGDVVEYFPHALYAKEQNPRTKEFPWAFGWNIVVQDPENPKAAPRIEIQELTHKQLQQKLDYLARHSDPTMERKRLVPMRPLESWKAKVTAVNDDGTVDLDVVSGIRSGITLGMRNIKVVDHPKVKQLRSASRDPGSSHPASVLAHTCYVPEGTT